MCLNCIISAYRSKAKLKGGIGGGLGAGVALGASGMIISSVNLTCINNTIFPVFKLCTA